MSRPSRKFGWLESPARPLLLMIYSIWSHLYCSKMAQKRCSWPIWPSGLTRRTNSAFWTRVSFLTSPVSVVRSCKDLLSPTWVPCSHNRVKSFSMSSYSDACCSAMTWDSCGWVPLQQPRMRQARCWPSCVLQISQRSRLWRSRGTQPGSRIMTFKRCWSSLSWNSKAYSASNLKKTACLVTLQTSFCARFCPIALMRKTNSWSLKAARWCPSSGS